MGRRSWWGRSLDRYFRYIDGTAHRKREVNELQESIAKYGDDFRDETKEYVEEFRKDVDNIRGRPRRLLEQRMEE